MKRLAAVGLIVVACAGAGAAQEDTKRLQQAIQEVNPEEAAAAASGIAATGDAKAVRELISALTLCAKMNGALLKEHAKILLEKKGQNLDPTQKPTGDTRDNVDEVHGRHHELYGKMYKLLQVRRAIREALSKIDGETSRRSLASGMKKGDPILRADCALALSSVKGEEAMDELVGVLFREKKIGALRIAILRGISGREDSVKAVTAAGALLRDPHWQVAVAAARFLGSVASVEAVSALIKGLGATKELRVLENINDALVDLTGVNKHANPEVWKIWWDQNKETLKVKAANPEAPKRGDDPKRPGMTTFYGIPVDSKRVVFVIDGSGSMQHESAWTLPGNDVASGKDGKGPFVQPPKDNLKISVAQYELKKVLATLPDGTYFNIIFFNHTAWPFIRKGLAKLDRRTRETAFAFIDGIVLMPATDVYFATRMAFEFAGTYGSGFVTDRENADTIYLLSDGMPHLREIVREKGGITDKATLCNHIRTWNRDAVVKIHTISIQKKGRERGSSLLENLAKEHGGTYAER